MACRIRIKRLPWLKICVLLFVTVIIHGQEVEYGSKGYYVGFGGALFDTENMEKKLLAAGFNEPKDWLYIVSFGFHKQERIVFDLELNWLLWKPVTMGLNETKMRGLTSNFSFGVNLLPLTLPMVAYPFVGSGAGKMWLLLNQKSKNFIEAVSVSPTSLQVSQKTHSFVAGVGYDFKINHRQNKKKKASIGLRVGYLYDISDGNDWESKGVEFKNGPHIKATGLYGKVLIINSLTFSNKNHKKWGDRDEEMGQ